MHHGEAEAAFQEGVLGTPIGCNPRDDMVRNGNIGVGKEWLRNLYNRVVSWCGLFPFELGADIVSTGDTDRGLC